MPVQLTPPQLPPIPTAYRTPQRPLSMPPIPPLLPSRNFIVPIEQPSPPQPPPSAENIELTPVPTTFATTNKVRLIYAKSGFYLKSTNPMESNPSSIHGFLSIFSKSMVSSQDKICLGCTNLKKISFFLGRC